MTGESYRCEVLVIGSGPGGSVTAWTLSERGKDVMLLEEGANLRADSCVPFSVEEMRQKYRAGGLNPAFGQPPIPFVEGCCVGGGSEINSGMYHRTPPEILGLWRRQYQVRDLDPDHLSPHFEACEAALSVQLSPGVPPGPAIKMRTGAEMLGWKSREVPRWVKYESAACGNGRRSGKRQTMTETLLPRAFAHRCRLMAEVRAERLAKKRGHWEVSARRKGTRITIFADCVFLCCGAIQTPALLRRSGIRKNIGNTLALHPTVKVVALFPDHMNDKPADVAAQQVTEFAPDVSMGCSISSLPYLALAMADHPGAKLNMSTEWRSAAIYYAMTRGPSTGVVRNVPFSENPIIRYRLNAEDFSSLGSALRNLCRLLLAAGAKELYPSIVGFPPIKAEKELEYIPEELPSRLTNLMTIHLFSSCPMGESLDRCAVNSFGEVHGHKNLFVNDASLLCTAPGVNPQGSIMAMARRNALHFAGGL